MRFETERPSSIVSLLMRYKDAELSSVSPLSEIAKRVMGGYAMGEASVIF